MTPDPPSDQILTKLPTPKTGEWALRLFVSQRHLKPGMNLVEGVTTYKSLSSSEILKPDVDTWGDYLLTRIDTGPPGYVAFYFGAPKTDTQKNTPHKVEPGDSRHYEWPTVLRGIGFAEDPEFPITVQVGVSLIVKRPQLVAWEDKSERAFALCKTVQKHYLAPTAFDVPQRPQPATSEIEWVINGKPERLSCLHPKLTLPAAGQNWSPKYTAGTVQGMPTATRTFHATPLTDWEPFVISQTHRQNPATGLYELVEEWIIPPDRAKATSF
jgi:hypothetical protein